MQQKKKEKDIQDKKDIADKDPYLTMGFGLIAYRNSLQSIALVFFVLSLLMYPVIQIYKSGHGIHKETVSTKYGTLSLGHLGYSTIQCSSIPFGMKTVVM